jgi:hypothetical protein
VDPYGQDSDRNDLYITHGVKSIDNGMVLALHLNNQSKDLKELSDLEMSAKVEKMMEEIALRMKLGSSMHFLQELISYGLLVYHYQWDNNRLTKAISSAIENKLFVEHYNERTEESRVRKIANWSTGGPDFNGLVMSELKKHSVIEEYIKETEATLEVSVNGAFLIYYDSSSNLLSKPARWRNETAAKQAVSTSPAEMSVDYMPDYKILRYTAKKINYQDDESESGSDDNKKPKAKKMQEEEEEFVPSMNSDSDSEDED